MINLLNNDEKNQYRAARLNLKLRGYFAFLSVTLLLVAGIFAGGLMLTLNERKIAEQESATNNELVEKYAPVSAQANSFTDNLKIAKLILSQEVLYSDMITRIAEALPSNAILTSLALDQQTLQKPITLNARVKSKDDAIILKTKLEESILFESVNINSIIEEDTSKEENLTKKAHPVLVTITMTITKGEEGSLLP